MEAKAHLKYARISPRKVKIVLDLIRGKDAAQAMAILKNTPKSASEYLTKLLRSAVANAEKQFQYGRIQAVCIGMLRMPRPDSEENHAESAGQSI